MAEADMGKVEERVISLVKRHGVNAAIHLLELMPRGVRGRILAIPVLLGNLRLNILTKP